MEKQQLASSAGLIALLALLIHTFGLSGPEHPSGSADKSTANVSKPHSGSAESNKPSLLQLGPWRATQQYFHTNPRASGEQSSCLALPDGKCLRNVLLTLYGFPLSFPQQELH